MESARLGCWGDLVGGALYGEATQSTRAPFSPGRPGTLTPLTKLLTKLGERGDDGILSAAESEERQRQILGLR